MGLYEKNCQRNMAEVGQGACAHEHELFMGCPEDVPLSSIFFFLLYVSCLSLFSLLPFSIW
jgi:hypothetical protein